MAKNINRDYLVKLNVKTGSMVSHELNFFNSDNGTSNIYVQLILPSLQFTVKHEQIGKNYSLSMNIVKPDNTYKTIEGVVVNDEEYIFEFDLPKYLTDIKGVYVFEVIMLCTVNGIYEMSTSLPHRYTVYESILAEIDTN